MEGGAGGERAGGRAGRAHAVYRERVGWGEVDDDGERPVRVGVRTVATRVSSLAGQRSPALKLTRALILTGSARVGVRVNGRLCGARGARRWLTTRSPHRLRWRCNLALHLSSLCLLIHRLI